MENQFNLPQRQSPIGVVMMFLDTVRHFARALWPIILVWIFKFDEINKLYLTLGILFIIVFFAVISYLKYLNFTFYIDVENHEFIVNEGVFSKTKTTIQLSKIQQVNINQSFIQKIIGVFSLDVDTAGTQKKEGNIKAVSHELALSLKSQLLESKNNSIFNEAASSQKENIAVKETVSTPFINISFLSLVKIGITSNYLKSFSLLLLFFITIFDYIHKFTGKDVIADEDIENYVNQELVFNLLLFGLVALVLVVIVINLIRVIFKYFDFKILRQNNSLLLSYGLLNTKSTILKPEKVQITTVTQNYFQKKLNVLQLKIRQASAGNEHEKNATVEIPGCNEFEKGEILKLLYNVVPEKGIKLTPNFRKLGFAIFLTIVLPLMGYLFFRNLDPSMGLKADYYVPVYIMLVGTIQFFKFKNNRLFIHDNFIIKQSGAWDIDLDIIEPMKIQVITTSQLFWHKTADIGYLTLHTAGGDVGFQLGNYSVIKQNVNLWLYKIEKSDSNWM